MAQGFLMGRSILHLLVRARMVAGLSQDELAGHMRVSKRTVARRERGESTVDRQDACILARLVYPKDRALAEELAGAAGETLESLGLVSRIAPLGPAAPGAPPAPPAHLVVDAVVLRRGRRPRRRAGGRAGRHPCCLQASA
jgi:transcriptional regulator with XRE-family HTH domain